MTQEAPAQDSANDLNVVDTLSNVAMSIVGHEESFGTEYSASEGYLTSEEVKQLNEQAIEKIRQIFKMIFDETTQPMLNNPRSPIDTSLIIKNSGIEYIVEKKSAEKRSEIAPLLDELKEMGAKINDDTARLSNDSVSTGALSTGDDDLIEL